MFGTTTYMNMSKGTVSQYHIKPFHLDKTGQKSYSRSRLLKVEQIQRTMQGGPLPVVKGVETPISTVSCPFIRPFIGVITPLITGSGAHLVETWF